jgi:hypothetical protein
LGSDPTGPVYSTGGSRHAHSEGFDLHANVSVRAGDNRRRERLCHSILRPPVPQDALELTPDGKVLLHLRRPWRDGTKAIRFEPNEFLEKLAVIVPRRRTNLVMSGLRACAHGPKTKTKHRAAGTIEAVEIPRHGTVCSRSSHILR